MAKKVFYHKHRKKSKKLKNKYNKIISTNEKMEIHREHFRGRLGLKELAEKHDTTPGIIQKILNERY